jgi:hypothetical protein
MFARSIVAFGVCLGVAFSIRAADAQDDFDRAPINYSSTTPDNAASRLDARLESGKTKLRYEDHRSYLRSLLQALEVPESSQMLVFSKTSLQRQRIAPRTPRAIYFSDDVYVGYCQRGDVIEVSAVDPQLGAVFYTLDQKQTEKPRLVRQGDSCLICHASSNTQGVPGHVVRSVFSDRAGYPILSAGTHRIDHTSPLAERWGGWYVTGTHGKQKHMGNLTHVERDLRDAPESSAGLNLTDLGDRFDRTRYLSPHSDIVALMVLEHQAQAHNLITKANFVGRQAIHSQRQLNAELGEAADHPWDSTRSRIRSAGDPLVQYLLMAEEAPLTDKLQGTSSFAAEFAAKGPRDSKNRSLRDLDLERRLFRYPCSFLVYSPSFNSLPPEMSDYVLRRMYDVLTGKVTSPEFAHLSPEDRQAVLEILRETKPDLPAYWRTAGA